MVSQKYGFFNKTGDAFIITDPKTPRPFDNFLFNDVCYSNVHQTGIGYMDYQIDGSEGIQLMTGVGRICDFDVCGKNHLYSRLVFIRDDETGEFWNLNWEPVCHPYQTYQCIHSMGYTEITNCTLDTKSKFFICIPEGNDPVECWALEFENIAARHRKYSVFVYNQIQFSFKWGFDSYGDMVYRTTRFDKENNTMFAVKHPAVRPHNYLTAFLSADCPVAHYDGSYSHFVGDYSTISAPEAVVNGKCTDSCSSADATITALQFSFELEPNENKKINILLGVSDSEENALTLRDKYIGLEKDQLRTLTEKTVKTLNINTVETPDTHMDRMVNYWSKKANLYGATWCRWGYNGYRDIVQHGMGVCSFIPERTKEILTNAMQYQYSDGSAVRGWNPIDKKPYSDSALWLEFTFNTYLRETGDIDFLNEKVKFFDSGEATVIEHINRALNFLESHKGTHGLLLIKFGDWNDSLTQVGKQGKGESVWLSMAYAKALKDMAELMSFLGEINSANNYESRRKQILSAINNFAWDGEWYLRCYDDDANPVGSSINRYAKIFMEAQSWSLISGAAKGERIDKVLTSMDKILYTPVGYQLLAPSFREYDEKIGRISAMEPGVAENGTIYTHTNIWMILGLLNIGRPKEAYELFCKITPGYENDENRDIKSNTLPYQYANCYFGPEHKNNAYQMEFTWITGSVAWIAKTISEDMLGIKPDFDGLHIMPCIPEFEEYKVKRKFRNAEYLITVKNPNKLTGKKVKIIADGIEISGDKLPIYHSGTHEIISTVIE